uniref:Uncharacterized protein n=1 Tax=viral metagenome TaxID=1070528 RepID=A0A6C0JHZ7_9ZZZZ
MSDTEERVNNETQEEQQAPVQRTVSANTILLSAVEVALSRGAFRMNEMDLITRAYNIIRAEENQRQLLAQQAAQENAQEQSNESD